MLRGVFIGCILLSVCALPFTASAQISKKVFYNYKKTHRPGFSIALVDMMPFGFNFNNYVLIKGEDDSLSADNSYKIKLVSDSLEIYDIVEVLKIDSNKIVLKATYYTWNYNLTDEESRKKYITFVSEEGVNTIVRIHTDSIGKKYYKEWHNSSEIAIMDDQLVYLMINNYNYWVDSRNRKQNEVFLHSLRKASVGIPVIAGIIFGSIKLLQSK